MNVLKDSILVIGITWMSVGFLHNPAQACEPGYNALNPVAGRYVCAEVGNLNGPAGTAGYVNYYRVDENGNKLVFTHEWGRNAFAPPTKFAYGEWKQDIYVNQDAGHPLATENCTNFFVSQADVASAVSTLQQERYATVTSYATDGGFQVQGCKSADASRNRPATGRR